MKNKNKKIRRLIFLFFFWFFVCLQACASSLRQKTNKQKQQQNNNFKWRIFSFLFQLLQWFLFSFTKSCFASVTINRPRDRKNTLRCHSWFKRILAISLISRDLLSRDIITQTFLRGHKASMCAGSHAIRLERKNIFIKL